LSRDGEPAADVRRDMMIMRRVERPRWRAAPAIGTVTHADAVIE